MKCRYCHQPIIADVQAQTAVEMPEGYAFVHETPCSLLLKREIERNGLLKALAKLSAAILVIIFALTLKAEQPNAGDPKTDIRGCLCTYNGGNGQFYFEAFIKTADKESLGQDGEAEIWGFNVEPNNPIESMHEIRDGKVIPVNAKASEWIPADGKTHEVQAGSIKRRIKCPPYW